MKKSSLALPFRRKPLFIARQGRHPNGVLGHIVAWIMARETARDNGTAISLLGARLADRVLDVGTGHGASLARLAELAADGKVTGVDNSHVMIGTARRRNRALIEQGRVAVVASPAEVMPFADASFDRAMAMHTLYFWDPAEPCLREIARVLVPGGRFVLGFRPAEDETLASRLPAPVYRLRTTEQVRQLLATAGFAIERTERRDRPGDSMVWLACRRAH